MGSINREEYNGKSSWAVPWGPWEIVCPDGQVRYRPFINLNDAEAWAAWITEGKITYRNGCSPYPEAGLNELTHPPCPKGQHSVRKVRSH